MYRNKQQRAAVCQQLCELGGLPGRYWDLDGPRQIAVDMRDQPMPIAPLGVSPAQAHLIVKAAWDIWDGSGKCSLGQCMTDLDDKALRAISSLLKAISKGYAAAIDGWLVTANPQELTGERPAYGHGIHT